QNLLPAQTNDFFFPIVEDIATNPRKGLLSFSFFLSVFLTSNGVNAIFRAFSDSIYVAENRYFIGKYTTAILFSFFIFFFIVFLFFSFCFLNKQRVKCNFQSVL